MSSLSPEILAVHWERNRARLIGHARTYVGDADMAEDLVQDLYTSALSSLPNFRGRIADTTVRAWLIGILNHLCAEAARRLSAEARALNRLTSHLEANAQPLERGDLYDSAIWLLRVADLNPRQVVIVRKRLDGDSLRAIALALHLDATTVLHHLKAAIAILRACPAQSLLQEDLRHPAVSAGQHVTCYHKPQTVGAALAREKLKSLK